jgi:predicted permease
MRTLAEDLKFGLRLLGNNPGFTAVGVLTLALGIAASTTVFSWIDGLLLRPFPGTANSAELAAAEMIMRDSPNGSLQFSWIDARDYRERMKLVSGFALYRDEAFGVGEGPKAQAVWGELVSGEYFQVLGVRPYLGRVFAGDENADKLGAYPVAVISYRLWRNYFLSDPAIVGKTVRVNRYPLAIVGVTSPAFRGTMPGIYHDIWVPATMGVQMGMVSESSFKDRNTRNMYAIVRLRSGVSIEQARAEAATLASNLAAAYPNTNRNLSATIIPAWRIHTGAPELLLGPLRILMAVAIVVLLIVCANVANLLLARSVSRQKEFGIRLALGAGRWRLMRQLFTETLLLSCAGAIVGLPLSFWFADSLPALVPRVGVPVAAGFAISMRVVVFTACVCVLAALIAGTAPAVFSVRFGLNETLKEGGRGSSGARSHRTRAVLVVSEVALAAVAVIGAGLFLRSFENARAIDPGFDRNNVLLTRFYMGTAGYDDEAMRRFSARLRDRLQTSAGAVAVSYGDFVPLGSSAGPWTDVKVDGYVPAPGEPMKINRSVVGTGYFNVLRIPLLEGRDFNAQDEVDSAEPVAIVNQAFAKRFFGGSNPVGRKIRFWGKWNRIVALARDSKNFSPSEPARPHFYVPFRARAAASQQIYFLVRTTGDPDAAVGTFRRAVADVDPNAGTFFSTPLTEWTEVTLLPQKIAASLMGALGLISLLLAAIGLYSVMAYAVSQRSRDIGIRMALGAEPRNVLGSVLRQGMKLAAGGLIVGFLIAVAVTRLVGSMLVRVSTMDPATYLGAAAFLVLVALVASYVPARRATRVDPIVALRCD